MDRNHKDIVFAGRTKAALSAMPEQVRREIGHALHLAQIGQKASNAKPLTGRKEFKGAKVLEIVSDHNTDTYRSVYTVEYPEGIYVVDVFQKKSKRGIETPQQDIERIVGRLKRLSDDRGTSVGQAQVAELNRRWQARQAEIDRKGKSYGPKGS